MIGLSAATLKKPILLEDGSVINKILVYNVTYSPLQSFSNGIQVKPKVVTDEVANIRVFVRTTKLVALRSIRIKININGGVSMSSPL